MSAKMAANGILTQFERIRLSDVESHGVMGAKPAGVDYHPAEAKESWVASLKKICNFEVKIKTLS